MINEFYNTYVIKFSKREYLEQIKEGKLYFKEAQYFKYIEEDNVGDSHEGTYKVNSNTIPKRGDIFDLLINDKTEINILSKSNKKTPIFCCSIINEKILFQIDKNKYKFKEEFINEMKQWENDFILINIDELLYKLYKRCEELDIVYICDIVKYDQGEHLMGFEEAILKIKKMPFNEFFHKSKKYVWQNEFRIIVFDRYNKLINEENDHFTIDIGKLEFAKIMNFEELSDSIIEVKAKK